VRSLRLGVVLLLAMAFCAAPAAAHPLIDKPAVVTFEASQTAEDLAYDLTVNVYEPDDHVEWFVFCVDYIDGGCDEYHGPTHSTPSTYESVRARLWGTYTQAFASHRFEARGKFRVRVHVRSWRSGDVTEDFYVEVHHLTEPEPGTE